MRQTEQLGSVNKRQRRSEGGDCGEERDIVHGPNIYAILRLIRVESADRAKKGGL